MDRGGFSAALAQEVLRFNGKLFKGWRPTTTCCRSTASRSTACSAQRVGQLARGRARDLRHAAGARARSPHERHALGAHYTPRAYVERLVLPTVVEPLRADWADAQAAALLLAREAAALEGKPRDDKLAEARAEIRRFHHRLCTLRVLDPACGSGNFLYVTLEHLKRLEGEVLNQLEARTWATRRPSWGWRARRSRCSSCAASSSTSAPPRWPSWCCGSASCSGTSAASASRAWPSR
jgi:hypothetical protein